MYIQSISLIAKRCPRNIMHESSFRILIEILLVVVNVIYFIWTLVMQTEVTYSNIHSFIGLYVICRDIVQCGRLKSWQTKILFFWLICHKSPPKQLKLIFDDFSLLLVLLLFPDDILVLVALHHLKTNIQYIF